jgi:hypothetical protein
MGMLLLACFSGSAGYLAVCAAPGKATHGLASGHEKARGGAGFRRREIC